MLLIWALVMVMVKLNHKGVLQAQLAHDVGQAPGPQASNEVVGSRCQLLGCAATRDRNKAQPLANETRASASLGSGYQVSKRLHRIQPALQESLNVGAVFRTRRRTG